MPHPAIPNAFRAWGGRRDKHFENEAALRLKTGQFLEIGHTPKFTLPAAGCSVFTIGSCFARNIEDKLLAAGVTVPTRDFDPGGRIYHITNETGAANRLMNKFTPHSIVHELKRVLEGQDIADRGLVALDGGLWWDPQTALTMPLPWDEACDLRHRIETTIAKVRNADAVFITLGLTETWQDIETGVYLNTRPPKAALRKYPDRFRFTNIGPAEATATIGETLALLRAHCRAGLRVVLTVSPVPLGTTDTAEDVIVANNFSKSVLRAAVAAFADAPDVDYFPSYEMVMFSPRAIAWDTDERHASDAMVGHVTGRFLSAYLR